MHKNSISAQDSKNEYLPQWLSREVKKGDRLLVPASNVEKRSIWGHPRFPVWQDSEDDKPWWFLKKGMVLHVTGRAVKKSGMQWLPVTFQDGPLAWIKISVALTCSRNAAPINKRPARKQAPPRLPLEKLRQGIVVEYKQEWAMVKYWNCDRLPESGYGALVTIETPKGLKDVWLKELTL